MVVMDQNALHEVEGIDPLLAIIRSVAPHPLPLPPILLLHGFGSSSSQNWVETGWVRLLNGAGRTVIMVDLPAHGDSAAPNDADAYTPSRMRADILQALFEAGVLPLDDDPGHGVDIIGYSLGARLAWEFGATQPELVRRMVLGGPGAGDPLADFDLGAAERYLAGGPVVEDPATADLLRMAQLLPDNAMPALLAMVSAIKTEPFDPRVAAPSMPLLLVAGDQDTYAAGIGELTDHACSAELLLLPGRNHGNAITSRSFKDAALVFLS